MFASKWHATNVHPCMRQMSTVSHEHACLGCAHAEAALTETACSHCKSMSLALLCSRIAFFSKGDPTLCALPFLSSQEPRRKKQQSQKAAQMGSSKLMARMPCLPRSSMIPHCSSPKTISTPHLERAIWSPLKDLRRMMPMTPCHWWSLMQIALWSAPTPFCPKILVVHGPVWMANSSAFSRRRILVGVVIPRRGWTTERLLPKCRQRRGVRYISAAILS